MHNLCKNWSVNKLKIKLFTVAVTPSEFLQIVADADQRLLRNATQTGNAKISGDRIKIPIKVIIFNRSAHETSSSIFFSCCLLTTFYRRFKCFISNCCKKLIYLLSIIQSVNQPVCKIKKMLRKSFSKLKRLRRNEIWFEIEDSGRFEDKNSWRLIINFFIFPIISLSLP